MKQIAALLLSTVALLTFGGSQAAEGGRWFDIAGPQLAPAARQESWVPVGALGRYVANGVAHVDVVALSLKPGLHDPASIQPPLEAAVDAIRKVVSDDPVLMTNLEARGYSLDDVVGLSHSPFGKVTLFVTTQA
jgi:hypothetical protein